MDIFLAILTLNNVLGDDFHYLKSRRGKEVRAKDFIYICIFFSVFSFGSAELAFRLCASLMY